MVLLIFGNVVFIGFEDGLIVDLFFEGMKWVCKWLKCECVGLLFICVLEVVVFGDVIFVEWV